MLINTCNRDIKMCFFKNYFYSLVCLKCIFINNNRICSLNWACVYFDYRGRRRRQARCGVEFVECLTLRSLCVHCYMQVKPFENYAVLDIFKNEDLKFSYVFMIFFQPWCGITKNKSKNRVILLYGTYSTYMFHTICTILRKIEKILENKQK